MKRNFLILLAVFVLAMMTVNAAYAQGYNQKEKKITLVSGKKMVIKSAVRDTDEIQYIFKARAGQKLTVKIIGRDADFKIWALHEFDVETISEDTQFWSKKLPNNVDGKCMIAVHSNYKVADYTLEILLK